MVFKEYGDDERLLAKPVWECKACGDSREAAPGKQGRIRMCFKQEGAYLDGYAGKKLVAHLTKKPNGEDWGEEGDPVRTEIRSILEGHLHQPYFASLNISKGTFYINNIRPAMVYGAKRFRG